MTVLITSTNVSYYRDALALISYPVGGIFGFDYNSKYLDAPFRSDLNALKDQKAIIILRSDINKNRCTNPFYLPLRFCIIKSVNTVGNYVHIEFELKKFVDYRGDYESKATEYSDLINTKIRSDKLNEDKEILVFNLGDLSKFSCGCDPQDDHWMSIIYMMQKIKEYKKSVFFWVKGIQESDGKNACVCENGKFKLNCDKIYEIKCLLHIPGNLRFQIEKYPIAFTFRFIEDHISAIVDEINLSGTYDRPEFIFYCKKRKDKVVHSRICLESSTKGKIDFAHIIKMPIQIMRKRLTKDEISRYLIGIGLVGTGTVNYFLSQTAAIQYGSLAIVALGIGTSLINMIMRD